MSIRYKHKMPQHYVRWRCVWLSSTKFTLFFDGHYTVFKIRLFNKFVHFSLLKDFDARYLLSPPGNIISVPVMCRAVGEMTMKVSSEMNGLIQWGQIAVFLVFICSATNKRAHVFNPDVVSIFIIFPVKVNLHVFLSQCVLQYKRV